MKKAVSTLLASLLFVSNLGATDLASKEEFNPFKEIMQMQQEMDKIFERFHRKMMSESAFSNFNSSFPTTPAIDLKDLGNSYELKVDIPGSDEKEINITTKDGLLKVEAKNSKIKEQKSKNFIKRERFMGSYMRVISLPKDANTEKLKSNYKDGVLTITIPKK